MYAKYAHLEGARLKGSSTKCLKHYHHVKLDNEFRFDCSIWRTFLNNPDNEVVCRPMVDLLTVNCARKLRFFSDASANEFLGVGAYFNGQWFAEQWEPGFIKQCQLSIEYLELYGVTAALLTWGAQLKNQCIQIYCDNQAVVAMINNCVSTCANCMYLLRLVMLDNLKHNRRVFAAYVSSKNNYLLDALSRLNYKKFWSLAPEGTSKYPTMISPSVWPASQIWNLHSSHIYCR